MRSEHWSYPKLQQPKIVFGWIFTPKRRTNHALPEKFAQVRSFQPVDRFCFMLTCGWWCQWPKEALEFCDTAGNLEAFKERRTVLCCAVWTDEQSSFITKIFNWFSHSTAEWRTFQDHVVDEFKGVRDFVNVLLTKSTSWITAGQGEYQNILTDKAFVDSSQTHTVATKLYTVSISVHCRPSALNLTEWHHWRLHVRLWTNKQNSPWIFVETPHSKTGGHHQEVLGFSEVCVGWFTIQVGFHKELHPLKKFNISITD